MIVQYAADPGSSVAASCKQVQKDLMTAVHNEQHMCPVQVQRSYVHKTNACTSEYADQTSSVDGDLHHISPSTASSDSTHKPCDQCELKQSTALTCAEQQCKHNWVTLATGVAESDILLRKHHQLMMKYAAQPSSSITAASDDTDGPCD